MQKNAEKIISGRADLLVLFFLKVQDAAEKVAYLEVVSFPPVVDLIDEAVFHEEPFAAAHVAEVVVFSLQASLVSQEVKLFVAEVVEAVVFVPEVRIVFQKEPLFYPVVVMVAAFFPAVMKVAYLV